jgi:hypothetical protein
MISLDFNSYVFTAIQKLLKRLYPAPDVKNPALEIFSVAQKSCPKFPLTQIKRV